MRTRILIDPVDAHEADVAESQLGEEVGLGVAAAEAGIARDLRGVHRTGHQEADRSFVWRKNFLLAWGCLYSFFLPALREHVVTIYREFLSFRETSTQHEGGPGHTGTRGSSVSRDQGLGIGLSGHSGNCNPCSETQDTKCDLTTDNKEPGCI